MFRFTKLHTPWQAVTMSLLLLTTLHAQTDNTFCWMDSFTRGGGTLPTSCPSGMTKELAACYTTCGPGYEAYTPGALTCEQTCPSGFTDLPGTCTKPAPYTVSSYPWKPGDSLSLDGAKSRCLAANPNVGCYQSGLLYYPNCKSGYHHAGDLVCSPDCPSGMTDGGVSCNKKITTRSMSGFGCGSDTEQNGALCYPKCGSGYDGVGPVCWSQCPSDHPYKCGAACSLDEATCRAAVGDMVISTVGATINIASMVLGGPGASVALKEAMTAAKSARSVDVLTHSVETGESTLLNSVKTYANTFGKQFIKTMRANNKDPRNQFWNALKGQMRVIKGMNKVTGEFGVDQSAGSMDLSLLTVADPTGLSSMVMSFTKYGSCSSNDFTLDRDELDFGTINNSTSTRYIQLTAQQNVTIMRIVSPALYNMSITAGASCVGKHLKPGDTCSIRVDVSGRANTDSELRIYTDKYTSVPYPVHILANQTATTQAAVTPNVDEAASITSLVGVWAHNNDHNDKLVIPYNGEFKNKDGYYGKTAVIGDAGRAYQLMYLNLNGQLSPVFTLNDTGDRLTGPVSPGQIIAANSNKAVNVAGFSTSAGGAIIIYDNVNSVNENFTFLPLPNGAYAIFIPFNNLVLGINGATQADGALIEQQRWNNGQQQQWRVEALGDGHFRIISVLSGLVLTVPNNSTSNDTRLVQSAWTDAPGQHFTVPVADTYVRRPWDVGCNAGETLFAGLCYDVEVGWALTTPGVVGKVCPIDWRDDGTSCWPPWTGPKVNEADPNGNSDQRHPLIVTDSSFTSCPANYSLRVISCLPQTKSKDIKTIDSHTPSN